LTNNLNNKPCKIKSNYETPYFSFYKNSARSKDNPTDKDNNNTNTNFNQFNQSKLSTYRNQFNQSKLSTYRKEEQSYMSNIRSKSIKCEKSNRQPPDENENYNLNFNPRISNSSRKIIQTLVKRTHIQKQVHIIKNF